MVKLKLAREKLTFGRVGQIVFVFREVSRLAWRTNRWYFAGSLGLGVLWGVTTPVVFYLEKLTIDRLVAGVGVAEVSIVLYPVALILGARVALEVGRDLIGRVQNLLQRNMGRLFASELDIIIGEKLSGLDVATIEDPGFADRFDKVERESGRRAWDLMMPVIEVPGYISGFVSAVAVTIFLSPWVAVVVFVLALPQFWVDAKFIKAGYELRTRNSALNRLWWRLSHVLLRNISFAELKILRLAAYLGRRLRRVRDEVVGAEVELSKKRAAASFWSVLPANVFLGGIYVWLAYLALIRRITVGSVEFYVRTLGSIQSNLILLVSSFLQIYENYLYVADLMWFLNLTPQIHPQRGKKLTGKMGRIEFENVWFRYREEQPWVLKGVSFEIKAGDRVAMVGLNGAGKSTIIKLLARFYDPDKGKVLVNGRDLKEWRADDWHKKLAILFQQFELYPFSVQEAIGYGEVRRLRRMGEIKEAAQKTGIDEFIEELPLKYKNPLDPQFEKGVRPSIGQYQRIGLSRILFRKTAAVLVLDEPTSSVDPEAEEKIFNQLTKRVKEKVLIFVTQRFSTVRNTDKILVIGKGKVVEQGSHEELMRRKGEYARLFAFQAKGYT